MYWKQNVETLLKSSCCTGFLKTEFSRRTGRQNPIPEAIWPASVAICCGISDTRGPFETLPPVIPAAGRSTELHSGHRLLKRTRFHFLRAEF